MNNKNEKISMVLSLLCFSGQVFAESYKVNDLGTLRSDNSGFSWTTALSADGSTVVGYMLDNVNHYHAFLWTTGGGMTDLGTLKSDNSGFSSANALSADGSTVAGQAVNADVGFHAFRWTSSGGMTDLGTLKSDNSGTSSANALSADGSTVAGQAVNDAGDSHAFLWTTGGGMTDLGTLKSDNSGSSWTTALSADGSTVAGQAVNDAGDSHAFRWTTGGGMTDLGTLKSDNSGFSSANALSADGSTVAGQAVNDAGDSHAFRWITGEGMTDLGTLKSDNSGTSSANALSADGSTVAGQAVNDAGDSHAFLWTTGGGMTDLGTLKSDNSGPSWTKALSADGSTVAGEAVNDAGDSHAFRWTTGGGMTDLGTLRSDNSGTSWTTALSAEGSTVAGNAVNDAGDYRAVLWKISKPYLKQSVKIVDVDNSRQAMLNTASKAQRMLALYQGALSGLTDARCQLGAESYCLGAFTQYDRTQSNNMTMTGLFGAVRLLPSEKLTAGASVNLSGPVNLVSGYDTRVSSKPGLGIFTRWQDNPDGAGLSVDVSGAFIQQDVTISREQLSHTEAGKGDARIKGWQAKGTVSWGIKAGEDTLISPVAGLTWQDVSRSAYTETRNAEFTAGYGKMGNKSTSLNTGLEITHKTGSNVVLNAGAGVDINLSHQREGFTGNIDYIGSFAYDNGKTRDVKPYVQAGVSVEVTRNSVVRVSTGWQETDYHKDNVQTALSYSFLW